MSAIASAATKVAISGGAVALILFRISRMKSRDPRWFGLAWPELLPTAIFAVVYLGWMFASDRLIHQEQFRRSHQGHPDAEHLLMTIRQRPGDASQRTSEPQEV